LRESIGNNRPVQFKRYIEVLEQCLGRKAVLQLLPMQQGNVPATYADVSDLEAVGFRRVTPIETGIARFVECYRAYYGET
jgi:UDP-glucuronate 4-epimerase